MLNVDMCACLAGSKQPCSGLPPMGCETPCHTPAVEHWDGCKHLKQAGSSTAGARELQEQGGSERAAQRDGPTASTAAASFSSSSGQMSGQCVKPK